MIQEDFTDLHNHSSEALIAAWKLLWSIIIAIFHYLYLASIWMRNRVEPDAGPAWVQLAFYEPIKLKYEQGPPKQPVGLTEKGLAAYNELSR